MGIQVCSNDGPLSFPRGDNYKLVKIHWQIKKSSSQEPLDNFNQTWHKASLGNRDSNCSNERPSPFFSRGDIYKIAKTHWQILRIFFPPTIDPISNKLDTNHAWVKGIQFYSNEGHQFFPRGDYYKIVKIHWWILKIFSSRTSGPI